MKISKQAQRDAKQLFRACLVEGSLNEDRARAVAAELAEKKPRGYFGIMNHFHRLVYLDVARRTNNVTSATPLSEEARQGVRVNLTRIYGDNIEVSFAEDPAVIGGMRVQVGSDVYDGTIRTRLNNLQEQF